MAELITKIDERTGKPVIEDSPALAQFFYENGFLLLGTDLGNHGVKIELVHKNEAGGAIILPPKQAAKCAGWLLDTLGQPKPTLPDELPAILRRIVRQKRLGHALKRGDKKKIQDALQLLKKQQAKN
jgi:hypothetical protein